MKINNFKIFIFAALFAVIFFIACEEKKNSGDDNYAIDSISADGSKDAGTTMLTITVNDDKLVLTADDIKINTAFPVIKGMINKTGTAKTYELSITPGGTGTIRVGLDPYRGFTGWDAKTAVVYAEWYFSGTSELTITGCSPAAFPLVKIPSVIAGLPVTAIGNGAFYDKELTKVIIDDEVNGIKVIGDNAFAYNQLTEIAIPNSVTTIGVTSFAYNQLSDVTIPESVISIGNGAFAFNQLTEIEIPDNIVSIGENVFAYNRLSDITIPESVISIGNGAFGNNNLTAIKIPEKVSFLSGFNNNELTEIEIPGTVTAIGAGAFAYNQLTEIEIPDSVTIIGSSAFSHNELTSVKLHDNITDIKSNTFANNQLTEIKIPDRVTIIGNNAFAYNQFTEVNIPDKVFYIDIHAFMGNSLTSITIGENVTLGSSAFGNGFESAYYKNNRKKGTYTLAGNTWNYKNL